MQKCRVVWIDDDEPTLRAFRRMIGRLEFVDLTTYMNAAEALQSLRANPPDLVVTDLVHPPPTGLDIVKAVRDMEPAVAPLVWVVSGNARSDEGAAAVLEGADALIAKPIDGAKFVARLKAAFVPQATSSLEDLGPGFESAHLEYKADVSLKQPRDRAALAKDVIAMANIGGGKIIVGFEDDGGGRFAPVGVAANVRSELEVSNLNKKLYDYITPEHSVLSRLILDREMAFVVVDVPPATQTPLFARKQDQNANLYPGRLYVRTDSAESKEVRDPLLAMRLIDRFVELRVPVKSPRTADNAGIADAVYRDRIERAAEAAWMHKWDFWTDMALRAKPWLSLELQQNIDLFADTIVGTIWPGTNDELERALRTLDTKLRELQRVFEVSAPAGTGVELFQVAGRSLQDAEQWASWYETWRAAVYDVAKSVNWLAAVVRRDFDPSFFLVEGKFILRDGYTRIPEFSDTERAKLP